MNTKDYKLISAIDIGSNYIRMCVAQTIDNGDIIIIEDLVKPTNIGRDTFSRGKISVDTINETCETLKGFLYTLREYKIKDYKAVSTTGIRESENQDYVIEQIRIKTGIQIEVINNAQERFYMYKALRAQSSKFKFWDSNSTLIVNITSGGLEISVYDKGSLKFAEYIKIGSLRLREQLSDLENITFDFPEIMKEFIESKIQSLKETLLSMRITGFIGLGGELSTISHLCYQKDKKSIKDSFISKENLESLYCDLIKMNSDQIIEKYEISRKQEEILLPSIIFFKVFLECTEAKGIHAPGISLKHGLLYHMCENIHKSIEKERRNSDIISSALYIASKYNIDENHSNYVRKLALSIFDQTYKLHNLGERERLYLEVASILHDAGKYINYSEHDIHSYNIIKTQNIMGFSDVELLIIAIITRYHEGDTPDFSHNNYYSLDFKERIVVSKLSAILQIAESLDVSHKQKIDKIDISFSGDKAFFTPYSNQNILLEEWYFANNTVFFEEVLGVKPIIKHKG